MLSLFVTAVLQSTFYEDIKTDVFKSGAAFLEAVPKVPPSKGSIDEFRCRYELTLVALALGDIDSRKSIASRWDELMNLTSRPRRFTKFEVPGWSTTPDRYRTVFAPNCIKNIWTGTPPKGELKDNPEVALLYTNDQKAREGDISRFTPEDIQNMMKSDELRMKRIREILKANKLTTGSDFWKAAFLFQHGSSFEDFATAHELAVCAIFHGNKDGNWIAGASYDRMMLAGGYPQRFGTQYSMSEGKYTFNAYDENGMNDRMRLAITGKTLDQALKFGG